MPTARCPGCTSWAIRRCGRWATGSLANLVQVLDTQLRRLQAWQNKAVAEAQRRDLANTVGATGAIAWLAGTVAAFGSAASTPTRPG